MVDYINIRSSLQVRKVNMFCSIESMFCITSTYLLMHFDTAESVIDVCNLHIKSSLIDSKVKRKKPTQRRCLMMIYYSKIRWLVIKKKDGSNIELKQMSKHVISGFF
jgi:hypothetical protein